nr:immunoglobulin heavy chain junction region [Mus musculus]MBK4184285.1 immunoglobulin heavy chain junction region [Mus musculus]MBK4184286.1 immunoglobulin heavy chain junction region [Mus musculus]MBK4184287.1 immunoglobulin heavy chain junction region [Mus musculus]MBK4184289.1 immunoglobulin heavy chain junction region [Mus musculus]
CARSGPVMYYYGSNWYFDVW